MTDFKIDLDIPIQKSVIQRYKTSIKPPQLQI